MPVRILTMKIITILTAVALLSLSGCSRPDHTARLSELNGYTQVEITGWRPFMAGENDTFSRGFRATSPSGARVSGAVTGGFLKGSTIRFD